MNAILEAMRTTGSVRYFKPDALPDEAVRSAIEAARFGPSGATASRCAGSSSGIPRGRARGPHIAAGYPAHGFPQKLTRLPVDELVSYDRHAG